MGACGLVQLRHSFDPAQAEPFRASPAASRRHLTGIAERLRRHVSLEQNDVVLDIGSGDGSLLSAFPAGGPLLVGIDPVAGQLRRSYRADVQVIPQPFSADAVRKHLGGKRVRIATAVAVLHGLDDPRSFLAGIRQLLDDDGIVCIEQVYLPPLVKNNAHDSFRPEHAAYYTVKQVLWLAERVGFKVLDVFTNDYDGGRFAVTLTRARSERGRPPASLGWYLESEGARRLHDPQTWTDFAGRVDAQKGELLGLLDRIHDAGERVCGWGLSAAGAVLLERYGIHADRLGAIGAAGPGFSADGIPIVSEAEVQAQKPDYLLALARHFREETLLGLDAYLLGGGKLIFPLPEVDIVTA
jgi:NDP-4-keto-2,6-dideoxyhexose 3-C-methyltransferase